VLISIRAAQRHKMEDPGANLRCSDSRRCSKKTVVVRKDRIQTARVTGLDNLNVAVQLADVWLLQ
jgi:hypothetical protein